MLPQIMAVVALGILQLPHSNSQGCLSDQQVSSAIRQMQKLLSSHEAAQLQSLRNFKKQLAVLQGSLHQQAAKHNESCTPLPAPLNGRRLGKRTSVGHEVHFVCDDGFLLVGAETRVCQENHKWSGQQPVCKGINECASNPCANGGTCVDGIHRYSCLCPSGWSGSTCQAPLYSYIDECKLFQTSRHTRICLHKCVNLPGAYQCTCPHGYQLQGDTNSCNDVDECAENQHNCSQGQTCINVFGGFRCVRPECPKAQLNISYVKTSAMQCERSPCPMENNACRRAANSISFHYLPLPSNRTVPRVLFKMSTSRFVGDSLRFSILGGNSQGKLVVQRLDQHTGELVLTRPAVGPTTLEVELEMSEFARKTLLGKHIFKITVFVSQYEF
ncbi:fibulinfibulin-7-like [Podarcis lilfordi]|uniref:Fibulinfibulin-7-like n=1 Tax=Podarcis lilfordi TaxID=74358 RepID=A0AA35KQM3_9SAUR|nr:fibulinfibulin-7-like [Podarcis lilfordi]